MARPILNMKTITVSEIIRLPPKSPSSTSSYSAPPSMFNNNKKEVWTSFINSSSPRCSLTPSPAQCCQRTDRRSSSTQRRSPTHLLASLISLTNSSSPTNPSLPTRPWPPPARQPPCFPTRRRSLTITAQPIVAQASQHQVLNI